MLIVGSVVRVNGNPVKMWRSNITLLTLTIILLACAHQQVSYERGIAPILARNCNGCHSAPNGQGYRATGLQMDSYDSIIKGTMYGSVIVPGDSRRSILNKRVEGRTGKKQCNLRSGKKAISKEEIEILKDWVDQGALNN